MYGYCIVSVNTCELKKCLASFTADILHVTKKKKRCLSEQWQWHPDTEAAIVHFIYTCENVFNENGLSDSTTIFVILPLKSAEWVPLLIFWCDWCVRLTFWQVRMSASAPLVWQFKFHTTFPCFFTSHKKLHPVELNFLFINLTLHSIFYFLIDFFSLFCL